MRREILTPRPDWRAKIEALGLDFDTSEGQPEGEPYWCEEACYGFTAAEVDQIEEATDTLHQLCLEAVERIIAAGDLERLDIPEPFWPWVVESWRRRDPDLYGRFDLVFDGAGPPKMLEYNADTPTALIEAAVVQWYWLEEVKPGSDQFNSIHEKLIARWAELRHLHPDTARVHFAGVLDEPEDLRRQATFAVKREGFQYILAPTGDEGVGPFGRLFVGHEAEWGLEDVGEIGGTHLYRIR